MRKLFCLLATVVAVVSTPSRAADPVLIGMLEEHGRCAQDGILAVRALFAKDGGNWVSLASVDSAAQFDFTERMWTIAFDGQTLGEVRTRDPGFESDYPWTYPRDYRLFIEPYQSLPAINNSRQEFGGWCFRPEVRPLVVNSHPSYLDPDQWKPFVIGDGYRELLFEPYMQALDEVPVCRNLPEGHIFTAVDLALHKAYRDIAGRQLVALRLLPNGEWCDEGLWVSPIIWFAIGDTVRHIGNDLELIDAGDYDNDGESEIVFWHASYNRDGYSMFFNGLSQRVDYIWSYH